MKFHLSIPLPPARHRLRHGEAGGEGRFLGGHFLNVRDDELVKSHIPYVVHASTKPVLSEPSTLRQAQGERWVEAPVLSEPFTLSRSKGDAEFLRDHHLCLVRAFARNPAHSGTSGQLFSR